MVPPSADDRRELGDIVQQIVARLVPYGSPDMKSVAEIVQVSSRTLQRRLFDEGRTFADLVAQVRCDLAQRMLEDPVRKVVDVALDLGYSDHAHFTRAFVRWTGESPRNFRRRRSTNAAATPRLENVRVTASPVARGGTANAMQDTGRAPRGAREDQTVNGRRCAAGRTQ
ncbi:MAG TPA: helix-turn-helix transcriptional regulator [Candidatus Binatia bacterium]|jgi:AraC-like DNA-binding protein|nr:helix-turn-helix transcriptional regulator [Candidatus Binatia bacterium]